MTVLEACSVNVAGKEIEIWPERSRIEEWSVPAVKIIEFDDTEDFHPGLIAKILDLENDETLAKKYDGEIGSGKVFHLDRWDCSEADLIHGRAIALFKRAVGSETAAVDLSWASLYRHGDYCMPHSHVRAMASIVYFLDLGTDDLEGAGSGKFCFADPRLEICCRSEAQAMTTPCGPNVRNGTMIIFPGKLVHFVDAYKRPGTRITISWNINRAAVPGTPTF